MTVTCGIIEDEVLGVELLERYISRMPSLQLKWIKESAEDLLTGATNPDYFVDIIFFDVVSTASILNKGNCQKIQSYGKLILTSIEGDKTIQSLPLKYSAILHKPVLFTKFQKTVQGVITELQSL